MTEPKNLAPSVRERLRQQAAAEKRPFDEVLTYYAMERFLYRLSVTRHRGRFALKGALMLPLWGINVARPTRDIDLLGQGNLTPAELAGVIADCVAAEVPPDGLVFDGSSIETSEIRENERYGGIRATFRATLERARIKMQVDVGLGDVVTPAVVDITFPALLEQPAAELVGYPVETAIAEKLEAVVDLGLANSRMKDFFDLWSLLGTLELDGEAEFATDHDKQKQWAAFVRRLRLPESPDPERRRSPNRELRDARVPRRCADALGTRAMVVISARFAASVPASPGGSPAPAPGRSSAGEPSTV